MTEQCVQITRNCSGELDLNELDINEGTENHSLVDPKKISTIIKYEPPKYLFNIKLLKNSSFLNDSLLLRNNVQQVRTLLTLMKTDADTWSQVFRGYELCHGRDVLHTCVGENNTCATYNLRTLSYNPSPFTENVVGFELQKTSMNLNLTILIMLRNDFNNQSKVVRLPITSVAFFDALFNIIEFYRLNTESNINILTELAHYGYTFPELQVHRPILIVREHYKKHEIRNGTHYNTTYLNVTTQ
ncbi:glycoprotein L [Suid betaherpesvirus 2]|uniref:Envelope glycoprotein L n=2 Tax=Suid betaherpesvirus 2 TaxID=1608255 RepID=U3GTH0_9BETA|nr:glycoprotein L [Suid betaherpesvirus 2]AGT99272.1 glycoprotein L [Suid betaherpesvirus 2]